MKRYLVAIGLGSLLVLSACGTDSETEANETEPEAEAVDDTEDEGNENGAKDEEVEEAEEATATDGDHTVGDTVSDENGEQTLVSLNDDIETVESGPIILDIEKINGVSAVFEGMAADLLEEPEVEYIQVDMNVENTSEDDVSFYASQATLITDTGEQLEPEILLSDHIDGDFLGNVTKSGSSFYLLENSLAEEVTSVELRFGAPFDSESFDDIAEDIKIEVDLHQ